MSSNRHFDEVLAIYALGGLTPPERAEVAAHLRECAQCRAGLSEVRAVVNLLPRTVEPVQPSPETRRKLMARVDADLAQAPITAPPLRASRVSRPAPRPRRLAPALAFALAVILIALLVGEFAPTFLSQFNQQREIAAILGNPNAQARPLSGTQTAPSAQGRLVAVPGESRAVLEISGLKPLPSDRIYEFWLIRGARPLPAGLFNVDANGQTRVLVTASQGIETSDQLGVTVEPHAGVPQPTGPLVLQSGS